MSSSDKITKSACSKVEQGAEYLDFLSKRIGPSWYLLGILLDYSLRVELSNIENEENKVLERATAMFKIARKTQRISWLHVRNQLKLIGENNLIIQVEERFPVLKPATGTAESQEISLGRFMHALSFGISAVWRRFADLLEIKDDTLHNTKPQVKALNIILSLIKREESDEFPWGIVKKKLETMREFQLIDDLEGEFGTLLQKHEVNSQITTSRFQDVTEVNKSSKLTSSNNEFMDESHSLDTIVDNSEIYPIIRDPCGRCVIFNNRFENDSASRAGTDKDATRLKKLFKRLCFDVKEFPSLSADEMKKQLKKEADDENNENRDCFVTFILSHGDTGVVFGNDGQPVKVQTITDYFNADKCKLLAAKPKLFFIQACRGTESDSFVKLPQKDFPIKNPTLNVHADIFVFMATIEGYVAFRNPSLGSWFIQELCTTFETYAASLPLHQLVLKVNRSFGYGSKYQQITASGDIFTQMPNVQHSLTKKFKFKSKFRTDSN